MLSLGVVGAVDFPEGVAAGDEPGGPSVVHRHPAEGSADALGRPLGVGFVLGPLEVDLTQAHHRRAQRVLEEVLGVEAVPGLHLLFGSPVDGFVELEALSAAGRAATAVGQPVRAGTVPAVRMNSGP